MGPGVALEESLGIVLQGLGDLLNGCPPQAGREQRVAHVALAAEEFLSPFLELAGTQAEHRRKVALVDAADEGGQGIIGQLSAVFFQQGVLVAFASLENQGVAGAVANFTFDSEVGVGMQKVVCRLAVNAEEQVPDGPEQRALARFVGTVNDMEVTRLFRKLKVQVGERSERWDL